MKSRGNFNKNALKLENPVKKITASCVALTLSTSIWHQKISCNINHHYRYLIVFFYAFATPYILYTWLCNLRYTCTLVPEPTIYVGAASQQQYFGLVICFFYFIDASLYVMFFPYRTNHNNKFIIFVTIPFRNKSFFSPRRDFYFFILMQISAIPFANVHHMLQVLLTVRQYLCCNLDKFPTSFYVILSVVSTKWPLMKRHLDNFTPFQYLVTERKSDIN